MHESVTVALDCTIIQQSVSAAQRTHSSTATRVLGTKVIAAKHPYRKRVSTSCKASKPAGQTRK